MTEDITEERAAEVGQALAREDATADFVPVAAPADIHLLNGKTFQVKDIQGWGWTANGIFATGTFKGYSGEENILVTLERVDYINVHYDKLVEYFRAQDEKADESPSA